MSTPNKRRRTSPTAYISVDDQENNREAQAKTTPKRASYQSPTKASLARSNPRILQQVSQAKEYRESEPNRRRSLRDAVLGDRDIVLGSAQVDDGDVVAGQEEGDNHRVLNTTIRGNKTTSEDIEASFRDIPQPEVAKSPSLLHSPSPPPDIPTPRRNGTLQVNSPTIIPRLVPNSSTHDLQLRRSSSAELPPTPVQLGSHPRPERPKGLFSSSPAGARRRRSVRETHITSSPLKPRAPDVIPDDMDESMDHAEVASVIDEERDEQNARSRFLVGNTTLLEEVTDDLVIQNKRSQLQQLMRELEESTTELEGLEKLANSVGSTPTSTFPAQIFDDNTHTLLAAQPEAHVWPPHPEDHERFIKNVPAYLNLFMPANLRICHQFNHKTRDHHNFVHQTNLCAPTPWPRDTLNLTFDVITTLDLSTINQIILTHPPTKHSELTTWISFHLAHPTLNCDLASLTTGTAAYFEASIKRASIFKHLIDTLSPRSLSSSTPASQIPPISNLTRSQATSLVPYLTTTQHKFTSLNHPSKHLMLVSHITLNWIGQAGTQNRISTSGFTSKIAENASLLFTEIEAVDGVIAAFEAVWKVLKMDGDGDDALPSQYTKGKGRKKGARRMTEFR